MAQALLQSLLQVDPAQRLTAEAVCCHPWALDLDMPESPLGTAGSPGPCSAPQHMVSPGEAAHAGCGHSDRFAEEQRAVECTAEAMQHLWLQQEALMTGGGCC